MKKYKLVGLTGTTGAGKGQVCKIFESLGYAVVDADFLARKAVENPLQAELLTLHFGEDIFAEGQLNRKLLGSRAFSSKEKTALLNSIAHPFITALFVKEIENLVQAGKDKIIFDAPQLFESKLNVLCDVLIAVTADENVRKQRIMNRDGISEELADKRIAVQFSTEFFEKNCDFVIENNGDLTALKKETQKIIENLF